MNKGIKYFLGLAACNFYRLLKFFPNNDPIMGFTLPFARRDKWWQAMLFPAIAMTSFDLITMKVGIWTIFTTATYGLIGLLFYAYFKRKKRVGLKTYAKSSAIGVLIFDVLTGPIMSSYLFKMPLSAAVLGQIPFTIMHLASAIAFTILLAPVLDPAIRLNVRKSFEMHLQKVKLPYTITMVRV